jgi:O-glycosyl hydrolase
VTTIQATAEQTITSFGASGAWWPNDLVLFPESVQANVSELLFSDSGLQLSSYRYNMGADGGSDAANVTSWLTTVESFMLTNRTYDFSRDHAGVKFLKSAQEYHVPYIMFFINAAPAAITSNKAACGYTLQSSVIPSFVDYITTVLAYWSEYGINITYISPMNEPDNDRSSCSQEGMVVYPWDRPTVFSSLRASLDANASASHVEIIGDETSVLLQALPEYPLWLGSAAPFLSHIAIHNYDYPTDLEMSLWYVETKSLTGGNPPPVKFTETCCSNSGANGLLAFQSQYDPTMDNALVDARYVWQFLTLANAVSFDWWTAITYLPCSPTIDGPQCATALNNSAGWNSGLIYIDPEYNQTKDYTLYLPKRFWVMRHFSYFIRPGAVRYDVDSDQLPSGVELLATLAPASSSPNGQQQQQQLWQATFLNSNNNSEPVTLQLDQNLLPSSNLPVVIDITVTDPNRDWSSVTPTPQFTTGPLLNLNLTSQSMTTVRFTVS